MNVSDDLLGRLAARRVRTVNGYRGDGINGIRGASNRDDLERRLIQACHAAGSLMRQAVQHVFPSLGESSS
jgi:3-deoxy-D-arabino-heptulosonate 7-phosphate (DAHP) synthase class II